TGWRPAQPLNGQRCLTRAAFELARPLAAGFGVETALTIDLLNLGMRVTEVEGPLAHRATGNDWHSQVHRARQLAHVARALAVRAIPAGPPLPHTGRPCPARSGKRALACEPDAAEPAPRVLRDAGSAVDTVSLGRSG